MITCIIIDDEKPARDVLELMIARYLPERLKVLGKAGSLQEGVLLIYRYQPELVFLDIEMPEEDGFRIFNYFQKIDFAVVFTTAYKDYAIKAIKLAALDYILKPVNPDDLKTTLELFEKRQVPGISVESVGKLVNSLNYSQSFTEKVSLPVFNGFLMVKVNEIIYCKADQNYSLVYTVQGEELLISKPLNILEKMLPGHLFYRIHKSHLVNLNFIKAYSRDEGYHVVLENGTKLDVAGRRNEEFVKALTRRQ